MSRILLGILFSLIFSLPVVSSAQILSQKIVTGNSAAKGVIQLNDPSRFTQVVVISDVHGMYSNLVDLLQLGQIIDPTNSWIAGKTLLIVLGNSIDKGSQSLEVLTLFMQLQDQAPDAGGRVIHVLGTDEAEFLADPSAHTRASDLRSELDSAHVPVGDLLSTDTPKGQFLHDQPLAARVGRWLFLSGGLYPNMDWNSFVNKSQELLSEENYKDNFIIGPQSVLEAKRWESKPANVKAVLSRMDSMGMYGLVFGHNPEAFHARGRSAVKAKGRLIKIDNGMAPDGGYHAGSLLVFTNPAQMTELSFPTIKVISAKGTQVLRPER